jgi:hypothetical protein
VSDKRHSGYVRGYLSPIRSAGCERIEFALYIGTPFTAAYFPLSASKNFLTSCVTRYAVQSSLSGVMSEKLAEAVEAQGYESEARLMDKADV